MPDPNLKIRIDTSADLSGAEATKRELDSTTDAADELGSALDKAGKERDELLSGKASVGGKGTQEIIEKEIQAMRKLAAEKAKAMQPPEAPAGGQSANVFKGVLGADIALKTFTQVVRVIRQMIGEFAEGTKRASEMAVSLNSLDEEARALAIEAMGPLGKIIAENSDELVQLAADTEKATQVFDEMWTVAGAKVAPALGDVAAAAADVDLTSLGAEIGEVTGGLVALAFDSAKALSALAAGGAETDTWTKKLLSFNPILAQAGDNLVDFFRTYNDGANLARAFDPERLAAQEARRLETIKQSEEAISAARVKAALTTEEKIASLRNRLEKEKEVSVGTATATDAEIQALETKLAAEQEVIGKKEFAIHLSELDLALRTQLNQALADGNTQEEQRLRWQLEYNAAIKQGADVAAARNAADLEASERLRKLKEDEIAASARAQEIADEAQAKSEQLNSSLENAAKIEEQRLRGNEEIANRMKFQADLAEEIAQLSSEGASPEEINRYASAKAAAYEEKQRLATQKELEAAKKMEADAAERQLAAEQGIGQAQSARSQLAGGFDSNLDEWHNLQNEPSLATPATTPPPPITPPPLPEPAAPAAAPAAPEAGTEGGAGSSAEIKAKLDEVTAAQKMLHEALGGFADAMTSTLADGQDAIKASQAEGGEKVIAALGGLEAATVKTYADLATRVSQLETRVNNLRV